LNSTGAIPLHGHLATAELAFAENANPPVIERVPAAKLVRRSKHQETLIEWQVGSDRHDLSLPG
jgi:hypothetical protein